MRVFCVVVVLWLAAVSAGCKTEQERRLRDAERDRAYSGAAPTVSWQPVNFHGR